MIMIYGKWWKMTMTTSCFFFPGSDPLSWWMFITQVVVFLVDFVNHINGFVDGPSNIDSASDLLRTGSAQID
jgi:hypothetical protein